jgi:hypothetical protein
MNPFTLAPALYVSPTPAGVLHVVTQVDESPAAEVVRATLRSLEPLTTDHLDLQALTGEADPQAALALVAEAQDAGWIEGRTDPPTTIEGPLGLTLPELLAPLSDVGQAALVDDQGFALSSVGFTPEAEAELSILAAEVVRLQQRRTTLAAASATPVTGWALVDHHGTASVTIFPLVVGPQPFVLIVGGLPRLGHDPFTWLVGALSRRYDANSADAPPDTVSAPPTTPEGTPDA